MINSFSLSGIWEKMIVPAGEVSEASAPDWVSFFALAASLGIVVRWLWQRFSPTKFDTQPEITLQRKLFDASSGKQGKQLMLCQMFMASVQWAAYAIASLGALGLLLKYFEWTYIIIGGFVAIALVYDKQQNNLLEENQKKLGIDVPA